MDLATGLVLYFILWFVILFTVLPWGVRTQEEEGEVEPGTVGSAPVNPAIWKKLLITSVVTGIVFGVIYLIVDSNLIDFDEILGRNRG